MKRQYKTLITVTTLVMLLSGCSQESAPEEPVIRPVKAAQVGEKMELSSRALPGRAAATQEVNLSFRVAGPLVQFPVAVGDEVRKGELLARIDPRDFEVELRRVKGQLEKAEAASKLARSEYERLLRIQKQDPGAISESMVASRHEQLERATADIGSLKAAVASAEDALSYSYLKAPFSGTVVKTFAENYEDVRPKQPILRLVDTRRIEFTVSVPEHLISHAAFVENIRVSFDAFEGKAIEAQVKEIGKEASPTTRTYPVTLIMEQPPGFRILPGMAGEARGELRLTRDDQQGGHDIPLSALFSDKEGASGVWVIEDGSRVRLREIKTGRLTDKGILVEEGLSLGEWIVTAGVHYLRDGQQVRILK